ncbi:MAG: hypothetical protein P8J32_07685, partial [bacterium]|nr:hypothetical protein [bacterium]
DGIPSASVESGAEGEIKGIVDPQIRETLEAELKKFNNTDPRTQGIDFFEFKEGLKIAQGATTESRAENAFKTAQAYSGGSLTKQRLLETAKLYQGIIEGEADGFEAHVKNLVSEQVGPQENELRGLEETNASIDEQIEILNKQKAENLTRINTLKGQVFTGRRNIDQKAANFEATLMEIVEEHKEAVKAVESLPESDSVTQ